MIDQDLMNVLNTTLAELCAKSGVPNPPAFQETGWGWCEAIFPHDVSIQHWETLNGFVKTFKKIKGVDDASGTGIVCKKDDDCEFSIEVSVDENLYELSEEEKRESCDPVNIKEGFVPTHIAIDLGARLDDAGATMRKEDAI